MATPSTFGRRLRMFRKRRGLTQGELARLAQVSRPAITMIENGRQSDLNIEALVRVADVLNVSIDRLVRDDETEDAELTAAIA